MSFLIGLTPRSRRAYTRRKRLLETKRLERITANLDAYGQHKKDLAAQQASNLNVDRLHASRVRDEEMTTRIIEAGAKRREQMSIDAARDVSAEDILDVIDDD